jgi:iron complex outermembrane receptor protein
MRALALALALASLGGTASAQEDRDADEPIQDGRRYTPTPGADEIVIIGESLTHQHLGEAAAITSFGAEDLKALRVGNIQDLADFTPNLEINTRSAASNPTLFIRGIGLKDYNANAASAVSVYQDGININSPAIQLGQLFDLQNVDVRRGPQGSKDGRNATAGAFFLQSNLPTDEFSMSGGITVGNFDALEIDGVINLPLIEERLFSRFAFTLGVREGTTKNACANWNPEAVRGTFDPPGPLREGSFVVSEDTLLAEYQKDLAANNLDLSLLRYDFGSTHTRNRQRRLDQAGIAATAIHLQPDGVCIPNSPGSVILPAGEAAGLGPAGTYLPDNVPQLEDFQGLDRNVNDIDQWGLRGILRLEATDEMEWILNLHGRKSQGDSTRLSSLGADAKPRGGFIESLENGFSEANAARLVGFEGTERVTGLDANPLLPQDFPGEGGDDPFLGYYNLDGKERLDNVGGSLKGRWELGSVLLTSLTGYEWYDRFIEDEGDANPLNIFPAEWSDSAWQFSQELRAEIGFAEDLTWTLGALVLYDELDAHNLFPDTRQFTLEQFFDQTLLSVAPYLSARYQFTEEFRVEAGVRYNLERKEFTLSSSAVGTGAGGSTVQEIAEQTVTETWTAPTGDLTLTYSPLWGWLDAAPVDALNFFARYARGFKGGHFNAGPSVRNRVAAQIVEPVEPEHIHSVELGVKGSILDGRAQLAMQGFRYWYEDLQVFDIANAAGELPIQKLLNAPRARVWGAELEVQTELIEGLQLDASLGWLDSRFVEFGVVKATSLGPRGEPVEEFFDYSGNRTIAAPRWSLSGIASYEIPLFGRGYLIPQYDFSYRSKVYLDPQQLDPISQPAYWLHNASLTYRSESEKFELSLWVANFADEWYKDDVFDLTREFNTILAVYGDPRTYGATLSLTW